MKIDKINKIQMTLNALAVQLAQSSKHLKKSSELIRELSETIE